MPWVRKCSKETTEYMFLLFYSLDSDGEMKGSSKLGTHVLLKFWTWQGRVGDNIIILTSGIEDLFN